MPPTASGLLNLATVIGTEVIGGILYYIVKNAAGAVHKVRSKQRQIPAHRTNETNEQHEEKFSTTTSSLVVRRGGHSLTLHPEKPKTFEQHPLTSEQGVRRANYHSELRERSRAIATSSPCEALLSVRVVLNNELSNFLVGNGSIHPYKTAN